MVSKHSHAYILGAHDSSLRKRKWDHPISQRRTPRLRRLNYLPQAAKQGRGQSCFRFQSWYSSLNALPHSLVPSLLYQVMSQPPKKKKQKLSQWLSHFGPEEWALITPLKCAFIQDSMC